MSPTASLSIDEAQLQTVVMDRLELFARGFVSTVSVVAKGIVPVRTGRLRASIHSDPVRRTGPWRVDSGISADAPYAAPVHEGARPHVIRPRNARALRFEIDGKVVFARRVNHPGQRAQPFLSTAVERVVSADPQIDSHGV
jgi:hypothetical protein